MQKQTTYTVTAGVAAATYDAVVELGFVPTRLILTNRTTLNKLEWNDNLPSGDYYWDIGSSGIRTLVTSGGPEVIDGSDKNGPYSTPGDATTKTVSYGFSLAKLTGLVETEGHILDITAIRDDEV